MSRHLLGVSNFGSAINRNPGMMRFWSASGGPLRRNKPNSVQDDHRRSTHDHQSYKHEELTEAVSRRERPRRGSLTDKLQRAYVAIQRAKARRGKAVSA